MNLCGFCLEHVKDLDNHDCHIVKSIKDKLNEALSGIQSRVDKQLTTLGNQIGELMREIKLLKLNCLAHKEVHEPQIDYELQYDNMVETIRYLRHENTELRKTNAVMKNQLETAKAYVPGVCL